jgi:hypothetical protein
MTTRNTAIPTNRPRLARRVRASRQQRPRPAGDGAEAVMKFQYRGTVYDADQMRFYPCDAPDVLGVYVTPDYGLVVVVALDRARGELRACRASGDQIERLAACLGAPDLLNALSR